MMLAVVLAAALLGSGDTLSGRVVDPDGNAVPGATVTVVELHRVAVTKADGGYRFTNLPAGRYTVTVRGLGFAPVARDVTIRGATALAVTLRRTSIWIEPVTVTATRAPLAAGSSPLPTAALSEDRLRREQSVSLAHALADLPGINALTTGQQIGKPVIRGLTGPRVLVLEDGSRLEDYSWSDEDGPSLDARLTQRVEVIRGPASVLYGSDALGGVVNAIPEELPDANGGPKLLRSGFEVSAASNNAELEGAARVEGASGGLGWRLFGIGRFASSLHTPAGELDNTGFNALSGEAAIGTRGPRGSTTLRYTRYGGEFKLLEAEGPASGEEGGPERKLSDDRVQVAGEYRVGGMRLETKAQWQRHSLIEVSDTGVSPSGAPLEGTAFDLLLNTLTVDALIHHTAGARVAGTLGVSGVAQSNETRGRIQLVPDARVRSGAVFGFEQASFGRLRVMAGGRVDARRLTADANARDYTAFAGNLGIVYGAGAAALSANVGRAWRAPTLFELFSNGPHLGEARYEIGDATLQPEVGTDVDIGVRWQSGRVRAELAAYRNAIGRFIFITPTDSFVTVSPTPPDSLRVYRYRQADARLLGGEAELEVAVAAALSLRARADAVRGTNEATNEPLPLVPPARGAFAAEFHRSGLAWADRAYAGAEVELVTRQTRVNPLDIPTGGYTLVNLSAGLTRPMLGRIGRVDLSVRNVANVSYRSFLSRYKEFALDPGRNVVLRVSIGE
jgi:outer membrane receptor protein involved in Fe transport